MKSTLNEILTHHKKNSVSITFHCGRNKMKFCFGGGPTKTAYSIKPMCRCVLCCDLFSGIVYMIFYHLKSTFISVKMTTIMEHPQ